VVKSIGVGGTSIFSSEIARKPDDNELPLHEQWLLDNGHSRHDEDKITDDQWFTMYG
jgi:hypothetical protein